jgi:hypothetical protein
MTYKILLGIAVFCGISASLSADIIIEVRNSAISAGGEGFVDVWLTTDTDVLISGFEFEFEIDGPLTNKGTLTFKSTPDTSYVDDPDYLLGNTGSLVLNPSSLSLTGSDLGLTNISLTAASAGALLARLHVLHDLPSGVTVADAAADQFTIAAVFGAPGFQILDDNIQSITIDTAASQSGTLTMLSSVPEPGAAMAVVLAAAMLIRRRRQIQRAGRYVTDGQKSST